MSPIYRAKIPQPFLCFRGYAANCRVKRDDEEEELLEKITEHEAKLKTYQEEKQRLLLDRAHLHRCVVHSIFLTHDVTTFVNKSKLPE